MLSKSGLKKEFSTKWKDHYQVKLFADMGFMRKSCPHCGLNFWTLDPDRKDCGTPPCSNYGFIGKPITKVKWDYVETWKQYERFFKRKGHASVPRYPVIDRWRPDLYFTIASIQDFQRIDNGSVVMEYPSDPLVVPQVCLRFNDIPNVGVTGRHHTGFIMSGQHSFGNYWKDRTIELNFEFINKVMGVPEKDITYTEDIWSMPDFSQFGPCLETFSRGLELANSVFSQFTASGSSYKELPQKVVDVGWGHERLVWFSNGTPTGYDAVFKPVMEWMMKQTGIRETDIFGKYSVLAGSLTVDEVDDITKMRASVARDLGTSVEELNSIVEPMQAMYAIADHAKTLLFALTDGGIPSNVGGGYNLRVILRRSLGYMKRHGFDFDLNDVAQRHARHLKGMFPELKDGLGPLARVLDVEKERYEKTMGRAVSIVHKELSKGGIDEDAMVRLYTSNGIAPEEVQRIASEKGVEIKVPEDMYSRITNQHMTGDKKSHAKLKAPETRPTRRLYYEEPYQKEFKAKVLHADSTWVVLDRTLFYPEGGGQPADRGRVEANGRELVVEDCQKVGEVIMHKIPGSGLKAGDAVSGRIDWERRYALMKMHTSAHVLAGVARKVLGGHIWQAGAQKGLESSRLDMTHYQRFSDEELENIESGVNRVIEEGLAVSAKFMPRSDAESRYGFVLYQGGASPGSEVRVVSVKGLDVEACGGTHLKNTSEIGKFKIIKGERIQDGVNRIEYTTSESADKFMEGEKEIYDSVVEKLSSHRLPVPAKPSGVSAELASASAVFSVEPRALPQTVGKFLTEIGENKKSLSSMAHEVGIEMKDEKPFMGKPGRLSEAMKSIFAHWKTQRKEMERMIEQKAKHEASSLLARAKENTVMEIVSADRKGLIEMATKVVESDPRVTVILANQAGDVVGKSLNEDMAARVRDICEKAGGSGGGSREFAQGRAVLSKLMKLIR